MGINKLLKKTSSALNGLFEQFGANMIEHNDQTPAGRQDVQTGCSIDCPRDTVIVEDVSGSMGDADYHPTRLAGGIEASIEYINIRAKQSPKDRIAIVTFDNRAWVVIDLSSVAQKEELIKAIRQLEIKGGTDIAEGLKKPAEIFEKHPDSTNKKHIILLTDGHGGHPVKIANKLKDKYSAILNVVGIGGSSKDVNESLLRKVATTDPDGFNHYRFIKDSMDLKEHYKHLATGLIWHGGRK
jgi:uncharacterized protein with von Willebrand factor type A (vWA) domain